MTDRSSYDLKVDRAEKHLIDLDAAIAAYCARHPYEVRVTSESKRHPSVHRFWFTEPPDDEIAVIAGDFLYNIHSALNHLACSFVPSTNRRSVAFPIFWQGVWEPPVEGENEQRSKDRQRWNTYTRKMPYDAVAMLKTIQPNDTGPNEPNTHALLVLNRLRNADAHGKLPIVASALIDPVYTCRVGNDIKQMVPTDDGEGMVGLYDGTELPFIPRGAVNVKVDGTPQVVIHLGGDQEGNGFRLKDGFRDLLLDGSRNAIANLRRFDRSA